MDFEDALERTPRLERVGSLHLRYETSLLIAEPPPRGRDVRRTAVRAAGFILMLFALGSVLLSTKAAFPWTGVVLATVASALLLAGDRLFPAARSRRFVLNFATESLRIDDLPPRPRTRILRFDDVVALEVTPQRDGQFSLVATTRGRPSRELLLGDVAPDDVEALRTLWRVMTDAFGVRRPGAEL